MNGGTWNRAGRRSGGNRPFAIQCFAEGATTPQEIIKRAIERVVEIEHERGIKIDWESALPNDRKFSAREALNAIGHALTKAGIENNLAIDPTDTKEPR